MPGRPRRIPALLVTGLLASSASAQAAPERVEPAVLRAIRTGVASPHAARALGPRPGLAHVMIELDRNATPALLQSLRAAGATLRSLQGRTLAWRRFVPAQVTEASLAQLQALPQIVRVSLAPPAAPRPMDHSALLLELEAARGARPALDLLTGQGTVVADLDSNAEVFHPMFFKADAGYFDWIDVNENGLFDVGTDAIDLDRDGTASAQESAKWQKTATMALYYGDPVQARSKSFDPAIDWLYLDQNGNGRRDYGKKDGFDDSAPALGEPLFVPDDVNVNGKLDPGERVARLGTSKFKKLYVHIEYYGDVDHVFERGVDLSEHENNYTAGQYGSDEAIHGTSVLSILAGDVALVGRRWVGVAPDADLLLGYEVGTSSSYGLTWAVGEKPDVMLHELAPWTGDPLDGSDAYSTIVDESATLDQVSHSCPVGNNGGMGKHAFVSLAAGGSKEIHFDLPDFANQGGPATFLQASFNVRGASAVGITLTPPSEQPITLTKAASGTLGSGAKYYGHVQSTSRGTYFVDIYFYGTTSQPPPIGTWTVALTGHAQNQATVDAYLMDDLSTWSHGAAWESSIATDASTLGIPSVADHCLAVGAHTGHPYTAAQYWFSNGEEGAGELRTYSGRGPRIDGVQKPDVAAPDNPWAAAPFIVDGAYGDTSYGGVWPFGGTSGAGPHVAGVAALLAQAGIRGKKAHDAIRDGALQDATTGAVPNPDFGWGRLSAAGALGAKAQGKRPTVSLSASPYGGGPGSDIVLTATALDADGPASALEARWDDGYDGTWDTAYGPIEPRTVQKKGEGAEPFKVRVRDGEGRIAEALVWVGPPGAEPPDAGPDGAPVDFSTFPLEPDEGGCGCRTGAADRAPAGWWGLLLAGLALARRRRA